MLFESLGLQVPETGTLRIAMAATTRRDDRTAKAITHPTAQNQGSKQQFFKRREAMRLHVLYCNFLRL